MNRTYSLISEILISYELALIKDELVIDNLVAKYIVAALFCVYIFFCVSV